MKVKNYYKILNIEKNASYEQVKEAYRKLVKFWHPDINPSSNSHEKFIEINEAYEILRDEQKRTLYNRIYNEYFEADLITATLHFQQKSNSERYAEYKHDGKTSSDFDILQDWIKDATKKADELIKKGMKMVDSSLETGFYAVGEIGNFFSLLFAIAFLGAIGFNSLKYLIELISGTANFSVLGLIFSIIGLIVCILVIIGLSKGKLNDE